MNERRIPALATALVVGAMIVGCGGDGGSGPTAPGGGSGTTGVDLASYRALVEQVAPPPFSAIGRGHADWTSGDYPIIGKVFSENEPMSLYANLDMLDDVIVMIETALVDWQHEEFADSSQAPDDGGEEIVDNQGGQCRVNRCDGPTPIQGFAAGVLGAEIDLQYQLELEIDAQPTMQLQFGFTQTDTEETVVGYHAYDFPSEGTPESRDSFVFYGHRDLVSDAIEIRGVFSKTYTATQERAEWVYEISTQGDSTFRYRMAWYASQPEFVASVIGGGDKDVEFALRYQQYSNAPAFDTVDPNDPWGDLTQVFGPGFSDGGTTFDAAQSELCDPAAMFGATDMPGGPLGSPFPAPVAP